jgi:cytochrome b pre-mRNA-processing protein 3
MGIGHKLKAMANAFYGRLSAYDTAKDADALAAALAKNLWRGGAVDDRARALADYADRARHSLSQSLPEALDFGTLPTI